MGEEIKNKVGIVIICYNISSKIFILQIEAIKTFCKDNDYVIEVFDNSNIPQFSEHIKYHSEVFGVNYTKTFSADQNSSTSHSFCANLAYMKLKDTYGYLMYLDHDNIPVDFFSVVNLLDGKRIAGLGQHSGKYFWPGLVMWENYDIDQSLINFNPRPGFDTGAGLMDVIERYGKDQCVYFNEAYQQNPGFMDTQFGYFSMLCDLKFCHMVAASGWRGEDRLEERTNSFINFVKEKAQL